MRARRGQAVPELEESGAPAWNQVHVGAASLQSTGLEGQAPGRQISTSSQREARHSGCYGKILKLATDSMLSNHGVGRARSRVAEAVSPRLLPCRHCYLSS